VIDLNSRAVNVEGNQEGAVKGYHPGHKVKKMVEFECRFTDSS